MGKKKDTKSDLSDSDLFRAAIGEVKSVSKNHHIHEKKKPSAKPRQLQKDEQQVIDNLLSHDYFSEGVDAEERLEYARSGIQHKTLRKLKRGEYRREAEIDLHGLTAEAARLELTQFLHLAKDHGWRCVRIIHGKGLGSTNNEAVLKSRVNTWLRHYGDVQAFCSATPRDGGAGAVYALLKRHT
ncbi:MAG TPA: DNA mismatch repair protein MutS [Gammaproteobacteria bacterium]|jgi:DNA-nicking Smr family endonuclease|nr:DNA mismatch repair protein MutS [Gammaproteobacteria bacterium]